MSKWFEMRGASWAAGSMSQYQNFIDDDVIREIKMGKGSYQHCVTEFDKAKKKLADNAEGMFYGCTRTDCQFSGDVLACRKFVTSLLVSKQARARFQDRAKLMQRDNKDLLCADAAAPGRIPADKWSLIN